MTVDTSAEAVERLAELLDSIRLAGTQECCWEAAATLRALAAEMIALLLDFDLLMTDRERAEADRDAARAEVKRLREALEEIERGHIPSMPMTEVVDELTWAQMWVGRLRRMARAALAGDRTP